MKFITQLLDIIWEFKVQWALCTLGVLVIVLLAICYSTP